MCEWLSGAGQLLGAVGDCCSTVAGESAVINVDPIMLGAIQPYSKIDLYPREIMKTEKGKFGKK